MNEVTRVRIRPKGFFLNLVLSPGTWVALFGTVYHPADWLPAKHPHLVAHEVTHLTQQARHPFGCLGWLAHYFWSKAFRLDQEARAIAVEINALGMSDQGLVDGLVRFYAHALAGKMYFYCARNTEEARWTIMAALSDLLKEGGA